MTEDRPTSITERVSPSLTEDMVGTFLGFGGSSETYKTTITDIQGNEYVGHGYTPEEAERNAIRKYQQG